MVRLTTAGDVDPTFAFDGSVGPCAAARLLALQDDGKVLVAGREGLGTWVVRRLSASGAPDSAFGTAASPRATLGSTRGPTASRWTAPAGSCWRATTGAGRPCCGSPQTGGAIESFGVSGVWSPLSNWNADARSVAPGPNGTVLVGVQFTDGQSPNAILRLTDSGALDFTYSGDGLATLHSGAVPDRLVPSADGRVLFADSDHVGRVSASGAVDFITRVFTPTWGSGALAFTGGGRVVRAADGGLGFRAATVSATGVVSDVSTVPSPVLDGATMLPRKVLPVSDGVLVAGSGGGDSVALAHLGADGTPRWSRVDADRGRYLGAAAAPDGSTAIVTADSLVRYSGDGERLGSVTLGFSASAVALQPDGRVLVAGTEFRPAELQIALRVVRYTADGELDPTFSGDGRFEHLAPIPFGQWFVANGLTVQGDGKVVVAGALEDMFVIRLTPDGELDTTFSGDGIASGLGWNAREPLSNAWNVAALDGGLFLDTPSYPVHLLDDGAIDRSFVSDVFATVNGRPGADGRLIVARKVPNTDRARLQRLDPDGALDPQFGVREFAVGELVVTAPASDGATLIASAEDGDLVLRRLLGGGAIPPARAVLRDFSYTTVPEGDSGEQVVPVTFDLAQAWPQDVTFRLTPGGTARRGEDYRLGADVLTIPAGQTRATVPVTVLGDTADEGDETIRLTATAVTPNLRVLAYSGTSQVQLTDEAGDDGPAPRPPRHRTRPRPRPPRPPRRRPRRPTRPRRRRRRPARPRRRRRPPRHGDGDRHGDGVARPDRHGDGDRHGVARPDADRVAVAGRRHAHPDRDVAAGLLPRAEGPHAPAPHRAGRRGHLHRQARRHHAHRHVAVPRAQARRLRPRLRHAAHHGAAQRRRAQGRAAHPEGERRAQRGRGEADGPVDGSGSMIASAPVPPAIASSASRRGSPRPAAAPRAGTRPARRRSRSARRRPGTRGRARRRTRSGSPAAPRRAGRAPRPG